jgi:hypothetical protein
MSFKGLEDFATKILSSSNLRIKTYAFRGLSLNEFSFSWIVK